jgi:hypothetical protein
VAAARRVPQGAEPRRSFTNIRGGHVYPALIRKTPKKPLRVFLQDGEKDVDNQFGSWWLANLQMDAGAPVREVRLQVRRRRRRPQRQARRVDPARFPPLALARLPPSGK